MPRAAGVGAEPPGGRYEDGPSRRAERQAEQSRVRPTPAVRTCAECGLVRVVAEFIAIRSRAASWYGRCRVCRAKRARERYWADPDERERQKARVQRNCLRRKAAAATSIETCDRWHAIGVFRSSA